MNITTIKLLKFLAEGPREAILLPDLLGVKKRQLAYIVRGLKELGYAEKEDGIIRLLENPKTVLFRDVSKTVDVQRLLCGSNETVFLWLAGASSVDEIVRKSGLSRATTHRAVSDLQSIGAITKEGDKIRINESKESLGQFAAMLMTEYVQKYEDDGAEVIYRDGLRTLRRVPAGRTARGETTAFTLFSEYGMEYRTVYDYFCEQDGDLDMQDVLMHAVYAASHEKNRMALLISIVFYAKHKDGMDTLQMRRKADGMGVSKVWLDVEAYIRGGQLKNPGLFLPWDEFVSKADMYEVPAEKYSMPEPSESLFEDWGRKLRKPMNVYLFGGENMRIKRLKDSTKDCDMVVENKEIFEAAEKILTKKLGYRPVIKSEYSDEDKRIHPDDIFVHEKKSRIDLFTTRIMHDLILSSPMREKADIRNYGKLKVGLLRNEHVFLLKAIAGREGDIEDMAALVRGEPDGPRELQHGSFDWDLVWDEILLQEGMDQTRDFTTDVFEQISYLAQQTGIVAPFLGRLRRHVIDGVIKRILHGGSMPIKEMVELLVGKDSESMIRNRIDSLKKAGIVEKYLIGRTAHVRLLKGNEFVKKELKMNMHCLGSYLDWRFYLRQRQSDRNIREMAGELKEMGFQTIGEVDEAVRSSVEVLRRYEDEQLSKRRLDVVGAARICIGLHRPEIGKKRSSRYFVDKFEKYHNMISGSSAPRLTRTEEKPGLNMR